MKAIALLTICIVCATSASAIIDDDGWTVPGIAQFIGDCPPVAAESATWSQIKAVFR